MAVSILVMLSILTAVPVIASIQISHCNNSNTVNYQDNKVDENDIAYENATFVNYDSVSWTFMNQWFRGTWMYIKSYKNSNMLLQVNPGGADANLYGDDSWYKHWQFEPQDDYFYIRNCDTGQYLWFDTLCNGAKLGASDTKGWNNRFQLVTDLRASTFSIRPYADTRYCVDISGRDSSLPQQEDRVQIWEYHGYQNQLWNIHVDNPNLLNDTLIYNVQNNPQGTCSYNYPLSGVVPGMVQDTLDSNSMDNMGLKFNNIYTAYNLFGNVDSSIKFGNLHVYQEVNTDYKFPFKIDSDGYRTFDSANMYVVKNDTNKKFDLYNGGYRTWWHDVTSQYEAAMDNQFIPYNTPDNASNMDYGFTMCMTLKFLMEPDGKVHTYDENGHEIEQSMKFEFTGDDDLWIYIDGNLRLDMGGIHGPKSGTINFDKSAGGGSCVAKVFYDDGAVNTENKFNLPAGEHEMKVFYMERAQKGSNLKIRYNLISKNNLKIDPNGGTYKGSSDIYEAGNYLSNEKVPLAKPVRTEYTFAGWKIEGSGRISSDNKKYFMGVNDTTLVAQWTPNAYNLKFDYNKPQDAVSDISGNNIVSKKVVYTEAVGELPYPNLTGYTFAGWKDIDGNIYTKDTIYNILGDTTLYAYWNADVNIEWNASLSKINDDSINALNLTNDDRAINWKFGLGYGKVMHNTLTFTEFGDMRGFLNVKINNVVPTKIKYEFSDTRINSIQLSNGEHVGIGIENGKTVYLHNVSSAASNGYLHRICFNIPDYEAEFDVNKEKEYSAYVDISVSYNRNNTGETTETRRVYYNLEELDVSKVHSRIRRQPGQANN